MNNDDNKQQQWQMLTMMDDDYDDVAERFMSTRFAVMACKREFFFCTSCFIYLFIYLFILELLQGQLTTWMQPQKHTIVHCPDVNFKTHVQGKQVYVGLYHLM